MPWIRRLKSGLWAATVYTPAGRITESDSSLAAIRNWAREQEVQVRRGDWIDPRAGKLTVGEWWARCLGARPLEKASRRRDASHWRCHVEPKWGRVQLGGILTPDIERWIVEMQRRGVGAPTIAGAVHVLRMLLKQAVKARLIPFNPAIEVEIPRGAAHVDRVLTHDEDRQLLAQLEVLFPGRVDAALFVELLLECGPRWEEAAAVSRSAVDLRRRRVRFAAVMEADGAIRAYPKSKAGNREVPLSDELVARLRPVVMAAAPGALVFTGRTGAPLRYSNWLRRVWRKAVAAAGLEEPLPTPHDCRHTLGSRLAEAGVPQHEIAALLGHGDLRSTSRYVHASDARFDRARQALSKSRQDHNSQATHDVERRSDKTGF